MGKSRSSTVGWWSELEVSTREQSHALFDVASQ